MGRFYQSGQNRFLDDFVFQPNQELELAAASARVKKEGLLNQLQNFAPRGGKTYQDEGWQDSFDSQVDALSVDVNAMVDQFQKDPTNKETLKQMRDKAREWQKLYSPDGTLGRMERVYAEETAERQKLYDKFVSSGNTEDLNRLNMHDAYSRKLRADGPEEYFKKNRNALSTHLDREEIIGKIDVEAMKYGIENPNALFYVNDEGKKVPIPENEPLSFSNGVQYIIRDEKPYAVQTGSDILKDITNFKGDRSIPYIKAQGTIKQKGYFQDAIYNAYLHEALNNEGWIAEMTQNARDFGLAGVDNPTQEQINQYLIEQAEIEAKNFSDQYAKVTEHKVTNNIVKLERPKETKTPKTPKDENGVIDTTAPTVIKITQNTIHPESKETIANSYDNLIKSENNLTLLNDPNKGVNSVEGSINEAKYQLQQAEDLVKNIESQKDTEGYINTEKHQDALDRVLRAKDLLQRRENDRIRNAETLADAEVMVQNLKDGMGLNMNSANAGEKVLGIDNLDPTDQSYKLIKTALDNGDVFGLQTLAATGGKVNADDLAKTLGYNNYAEIVAESEKSYGYDAAHPAAPSGLVDLNLSETEKGKPGRKSNRPLNAWASHPVLGKIVSPDKNGFISEDAFDFEGTNKGIISLKNHTIEQQYRAGISNNTMVDATTPGYQPLTDSKGNIKYTTKDGKASVAYLTDVDGNPIAENPAYQTGQELKEYIIANPDNITVFSSKNGKTAWENSSEFGSYTRVEDGNNEDADLAASSKDVASFVRNALAEGSLKLASFDLNRDGIETVVKLVKGDKPFSDKPGWFTAWGNDADDLESEVFYLNVRGEDALNIQQKFIQENEGNFENTLGQKSADYAEGASEPGTFQYNYKKYNNELKRVISKAKDAKEGASGRYSQIPQNFFLYNEITGKEEGYTLLAKKDNLRFVRANTDQTVVDYSNGEPILLNNKDAIINYLAQITTTKY